MNFPVLFLMFSGAIKGDMTAGASLVGCTTTHCTNKLVTILNIHVGISLKSDYRNKKTRFSPILYPGSLTFIAFSVFRVYSFLQDINNSKQMISLIIISTNVGKRGSKPGWDYVPMS